MNKLLMFLLRSNKTEAIRNKYRGAKFMKVADLPELKGEVKFHHVHALIVPCPGTVETCSKEALIWEGAISNATRDLFPAETWGFSPRTTRQMG